MIYKTKHVYSSIGILVLLIDKKVGWINQILVFGNCGTKDTWESWNIHMQVKR